MNLTVLSYLNKVVEDRFITLAFEHAAFEPEVQRIKERVIDCFVFKYAGL